MLGVLLRCPQQRTHANHAGLVTRRCNNDSLAVEYLALALVYAVCPVHNIAPVGCATCLQAGWRGVTIRSRSSRLAPDPVLLADIYPPYRKNAARRTGLELIDTAAIGSTVERSGVTACLVNNHLVCSCWSSGSVVS